MLAIQVLGSIPDWDGHKNFSDLHTKTDKWEDMWEKTLYVGFIALEKAYDMVNRETLWQVLRLYDVGGKLLGGIKSM